MATERKTGDRKTVKTKNWRGQSVVAFHDEDGKFCSLQKTTERGSFVFFGCNEPIDKIGEALDIDETGVMNNPKITTRMHLSRAQVRVLLPHLTKFVHTGDF
jgi:hypothetical protein